MVYSPDLGQLGATWERLVERHHLISIGEAERRGAVLDRARDLEPVGGRLDVPGAELVGPLADHLDRVGIRPTQDISLMVGPAARGERGQGHGGEKRPDRHRTMIATEWIAAPGVQSRRRWQNSIRPPAIVASPIERCGARRRSVGLPGLKI